MITELLFFSVLFIYLCLNFLIYLLLISLFIPFIQLFLAHPIVELMSLSHNCPALLLQYLVRFWWNEHGDHLIGLQQNCPYGRGHICCFMGSNLWMWWMHLFLFLHSHFFLFLCFSASAWKWGRHHLKSVMGQVLDFCLSVAGFIANGWTRNKYVWGQTRKDEWINP